MSFAICLSNEGYAASLEKRKLYALIPDAKAAEKGFVRIIDESGEDYLYPARFFAAIPLPHELEEAIEHAA
jgi:hypothetical protein